MTWDTIYMPNSKLPAHIGHIAAIMHSRAMFLIEKAFLLWSPVPDTTCRWGIVHDIGATSGGMESQRSLVKAMGITPDFEIEAEDYTRLTPRALCSIFRMEERVMGIVNTTFPKLLALQSARWHVRGWELKPEEYRERALASVLGLSYPTILYAPYLATKDGEKICSSNPEHERFTVDINSDLLETAKCLRERFSPGLEVTDDQISQECESDLDIDMEAFRWSLSAWCGDPINGRSFDGDPRRPIIIE